MKISDPIYLKFLEALKYEAHNNWHRQQGVLATNAGISKSAISDILKKNIKASYEVRAALAKACGYEYEDFIELGKNLLNGVEKPKKNTKKKPHPINNVIKIYNNILEKSKLDLDPEGQEKLFYLIKRRLQENTEAETEVEIIDILSLTQNRKRE